MKAHVKILLIGILGTLLIYIHFPLIIFDTVGLAYYCVCLALAIKWSQMPETPTEKIDIDEYGRWRKGEIKP